MFAIIEARASMPPEPTKIPATNQGSESYLARHWRGELSLAKTFWLDGIALSVAVFFLAAAIEEILFRHFQREPGLTVLLIVTTFLIGLCSFIWSLVGLWRSARSFAGSRIWSVLARLVAVVWLGLVSLFWITSSQTLITTYYNCTTGRDFGELARFFNLGPCEVAWYPKRGLVVRRLDRSSFGPAVDLFK